MSETVPLIYTRTAPPLPLSVLGRLISAGVAGACLSVLILAAHLAPSPTGVGSHTGLGLQKCAFEQRSGVPCPTCGMTTSFSHFARLHVARSIHTQPMGFVLAVLACVTFWVSAYVAATGRPVHRLVGMLPYRFYLVPLTVMFMLGWSYKIVVHIKGVGGSSP